MANARHHASLMRMMEEVVPFNQHLGLKVEELSEGYCRMRIPWADHLTGDPGRPAVHGGVLATLVDVAGGTACWTVLEDENGRLSTIDLRIDYLRPGPAKDMVCDAHLVRMGNKVCTARMEVFSEDDDRSNVGPIATGQGVYNVAKAKTKT
ncbi:MAG: thioesterase family protein [Myxococcota bacterium]|nr:thioesterase family protein [Myxococcota bacterium]